MAIDAKQAAQIAAKYYKDVTGEQMHVTLEEVEFDDVENHWLITLGLTPTAQGQSHMHRVLH
jgi:hypothetical protein